MTLKSLITIDVDDSSFVAFKEKFQEFQNVSRVSMGLAPIASVLGSGGSAGGVAPSGGGITGAPDDADLAEVVGLLAEIKGLVARIATETARHGGEGGGSGSEVGAVAGGAADFLTFLKGGLGKIALTGLVGGLAGALGIDAIEKALTSVLHGAGLGERAGDVTALRAAAREANVSMGTYRAFQVDFAPYGDGEQLLRSVAAVQSNIQSPGNIALQRGGVASGASADVGAVSILEQARQAYEDTRSDPRMLDTVLQQRQLTEFGVDASFARSVGAIGDKEFGQLLQNLQSDAKKFQVPDNTAQVWQQLNQTIARSAASIDTVFTKTLPGAAQAETIALGYLTTKITQAGDALDHFFPALTLGVTPGTSLQQMGTGAAQELPAAGQAIAGGAFDPGVGSAPGRYNAVEYLAAESFGATGVPQLPPKGYQWKDMTQAPATPMPPALVPFAWKDIATALGQQESGGNPNAVSPAGGEGLWQIMPATGQQ